MMRRIECRKCGAKSYRKPLPPEDVQTGFVRRQVFIACKKPDYHGITINDVHTPLDSLFCDLCGERIQDGDIAFAGTTWNTNREGEPGWWEKEYGAVIPEESAVLTEILSRD